MAGRLNTPIGYQALAITAGNTVGLTPTFDTKFCLIRAEGSNVRWLDNGTPPTATTGMPMLTTDEPYSHWGDLENTIFYAAANATVHVTYYR